MNRVVLYADDMEPITVLELSAFAAECLEVRGRVVIPVMSPPICEAYNEGSPAIATYRTVTIWAERIRRNNTAHLMLFTRDEVAALMLRSELLPGQRRDVHAAEKKRYLEGFVAGLTAVLGEGE